MSLLTSSVDLDMIEPVSLDGIPDFRNHQNNDQVESLANLFLKLGDTVRPIILRKISPISFRVLAGHFEYYAALKAQEKNEQFTAIRAYVVPPELESTILEQYDFLRSLSSSTDEITPTPTSSTSPQLPDLAQMEKNISDRLEQKLMGNLRSMIENTVKQIVNESLEGFGSQISNQITNHLDKQLTELKQSLVVVAADQTTKSKAPVKTQVPSKSKPAADILNNKNTDDNDPKRLEVVNDCNTLNMADLERKLAKSAKGNIKFARLIHEQRSHQLFTSIDDIKTNVKGLAEKTMQKIIDAW